MPASSPVLQPTATARPALLLGFGLVLMALAALPIDVPLARWLLDGHTPHWLSRLCAWSEAFAHGLGIAAVALAIFLLDPRHRAALPRLLTAALGAGILADGCKMLLSRSRPRAFAFDGNVLDTFGAWLPWWQGESNGQSFPSSHAACAAGLAVMLIWLYPHGRRLFVGLAVLACLQRMVAGAHFLSDVLAGACVGYLWSKWCLGSGRLARAFDRWERRGEQRSAAHADLRLFADDGDERPHSARAVS